MCSCSTFGGTWCLLELIFFIVFIALLSCRMVIIGPSSICPPIHESASIFSTQKQLVYYVIKRVLQNITPFRSVCVCKDVIILMYSYFGSSCANPPAHILVLCCLFKLGCVALYCVCCHIHCHVLEWLLKGFGLIIEFIDHLQIVTTSNYIAIANSHTLQFTAARTKSSQPAVSSPVVVW
jgi:hypothetical protein